MSIAARPLFAFDNSYVRELGGLYEPWQAIPAPAPRLLALNEELATELGVDGDALRAPDGFAVLVGNATPDGASPVAQAYAGHQFGGFVPSLGDGRALLLGEVLDVHGRRRDLHLKGSGRTPFARGGDGKAAVGPMLREYAMGEAMHALGIPTTRALAVVATGEHAQARARRACTKDHTARTRNTPQRARLSRPAVVAMPASSEPAAGCR
jgi:serine/tyrosine/threonine adenylyltransferase